MNITVVIAAYNEADNIDPLTSRLISVLDGMEQVRWRLIYVIEGTDGTREAAQRFAETRPEITIFYNPRPSGLGNAFKKGFAAIPEDSDIVITMDADLNHQPEEIPRLVSVLERRKADIVIGSRKVAGSSVNGTPFWKRAISDVINRGMRIIMRMPVSDQTSGYRVYRCSALRAISFSNTGFAFLPEILLRARSLGLSMVEEPIRFVFREAGESKMAIAPTARSYISLFLRYGVSAYTMAAIAVLLLGCAVRFAMAYPTHKYDGDSDGVLGGLCALQVLDGHRPVFFPGGYRLSSQTCYVTAAAFSAFGVSRESLAITAFLFSTLFGLFMYLGLRRMAGKQAALPALLLIVLPPTEFLMVTYISFGYAEIFMWMAATIWAATLIWSRQEPRAYMFLLLGVCAGMALWSSIQSLMITLPVAVLLLSQRATFTPKRIGSALAGVLIGASPLVWFFASAGYRAYVTSFSISPVRTVQQFTSNALYSLTFNIPVLLAGDRFSGFRTNALAVFRFTLYTGLILFAVMFLGRRLRWRKFDGAAQCAALAVLVLAACIGLYASSGAGSIRGWTLRYVVPAYLAFPLAAAAVVKHVEGRRRMLAAMAVVVIAVANTPGYPVLANQGRKVREQQARLDDQMIRWLGDNGIRAVVGDYWVAYNLNFHSRRKVLAIPVYPANDYFGVEQLLPFARTKWAILDNNKEHLERWKSRLGIDGLFIALEPTVYAFIPAVNPPEGSPHTFLAAVRTANPDQ